MTIDQQINITLIIKRSVSKQELYILLIVRNSKCEVKYHAQDTHVYTSMVTVEIRSHDNDHWVIHY